ncbi:MAG TPA: NAD(P)H-binding protein [Thermoleophilaceae bacterium]|nr:NAD(P)H-binding protein [Thermoleophilaceae bacterium]
MILLTGASGTIGSALLRRLTSSAEPVRCLVRDPRRLGDQRVRVQIALGDLADPPSFRNALRGVHTVIHLGASIRDQPRASIEELNAMATLRLVRAAERTGARRFVFFSALGAEHHSRTRFFRAKALAEDAVEAAELETVVFSPSIVYAPGDPWLTLLERFSYLPAIPVSGSGRSLYQPIWAEDVADCVMAALDEGGTNGRRFELAGPQTISYEDLVRLALRASGRRRRLVNVPLPVVRSSLRALGRVVGPHVFATWEEAELMEEPMTTSRGTADAESLGVRPLPMGAVLGGR